MTERVGLRECRVGSKRYGASAVQRRWRGCCLWSRGRSPFWNRRWSRGWRGSRCLNGESWTGQCQRQRGGTKQGDKPRDSDRSWCAAIRNASEHCSIPRSVLTADTPCSNHSYADPLDLRCQCERYLCDVASWTAATGDSTRESLDSPRGRRQGGSWGSAACCYQRCRQKSSDPPLNGPFVREMWRRRPESNR